MTDLIESLLEDFDEPVTEETKEVFRIEDDGKANWALRVLWSIEQEKERIENQAKAETERIKQWKEDRLSPLTSRHSFLESALIGYHKTLQQEGKAQKTYPLSAGNLKSIKAQKKIVVLDKDAFIKWVRQNNKLDYVKLEPLVSTMSDIPVSDGWLVDEDGERIPGVRAEIPVEDNYSAKTKI